MWSCHKSSANKQTERNKPMLQKVILSSAIGSLLLLPATVTAWPTTTGPTTGPRPIMTRPPKPVEPLLVTVVDLEKKTITIQKGKTEAQICTFDDFTRIAVNGKLGKISEVKPGMKVSVVLAADVKKLTRIDAETVTK
jgi:hypothetical protein